MIVVIEGTMADVCAASRGISHNAITGTIAAWTLRYCPFVFCGSQQEAANFAFRFLAAQMRDAERMAKAISPPALDGFLRWRLPASPLAERCKMAAWSSGVSFMKCTIPLYEGQDCDAHWSRALRCMCEVERIGFFDSHWAQEQARCL
jgi:hypothetical protein